MKTLTREIALNNNEFIAAGLLRRIEANEEIYVFAPDEVAPKSKFLMIRMCRQGYFGRRWYSDLRAA